MAAKSLILLLVHDAIVMGNFLESLATIDSLARTSADTESDIIFSLQVN
jgi:hypothetical protein